MSVKAGTKKAPSKWSPKGDLGLRDDVSENALAKFKHRGKQLVSSEAFGVSVEQPGSARRTGRPTGATGDSGKAR